MSIILKALKIGSEEDKSNADEKSVEGFFTGRSAPAEKKGLQILRGLKLKRVYILAGVFIMVMAFVVGVRIFTGSKQRVIPIETETVSHVSPSPSDTAAPGAAVQPPMAEAVVSAPVTDSAAGPHAYLANQGMDAFDAGNYDESITLFKNALEADPDNAMVHNSLGLAFLEKKLYSSAAGEFQKALEIDNGCSECFNNFGLLKSILGELVEAKSYFERAISLSGSYPDPYFNMGVMYEKSGDLGNAVKYYKQFLELYPEKNSDTYTMVKKRIAELAGE